MVSDKAFSGDFMRSFKAFSAIKDTLILAHIEAEAIEDTLKSATPETIEKALIKIQKLKEKIEECI